MSERSRVKAKIVNVLQENQLWIGVAFALILVCFLMYAFKTPNMSTSQHNIVKFLSSLCAAFAGAAIAGTALLNFRRVVGGTDLAISGTAGFALFFAVWFFFPKPTTNPTYPDAFNFSLPESWTFQQTIDTIVSRDRAFITYVGFRAEELSATMKKWEISCQSPLDAIARLGALTVVPGAIRDYTVTLRDSTYTLAVKPGENPHVK
jgi:hypothetical protein